MALDFGEVLATGTERGLCGLGFTDGNYASNTIWLNGFYYFTGGQRLTPYLGAGIGLIEEIDIDLEAGDAPERSFSDNGDVTWQVFAGLDYRLGQRWDLNAELRYSILNDVDLKEETGDGRLSGLDYNPVTMQLGVRYRF